MTELAKVLGQADPNATTLTDIYTVPASTNTVISSLVVCNRSAIATEFRVSIAPAGASNDPEQYIYYDLSISGNDTFIATIGIGLEATDVVRVYNTLATLSFTVTGIERNI